MLQHTTLCAAYKNIKQNKKQLNIIMFKMYVLTYYLPVSNHTSVARKIMWFCNIIKIFIGDFLDSLNLKHYLRLRVCSNGKSRQSYMGKVTTFQ